MKTRGLFLMAAAVTAGLGFSVAAQAAAIVPNGGFESEQNLTTPTDWVFASWMAGTPGYVTAGTAGADVYEGTHAVTLSNVGTGGPYTAAQWFTGPSFVLTPGVSTTITAAIKVENAGADDRTYTGLNLLDSGGNYITSAYTVILYGNTSGWSEYSNTFTVPANATQAVTFANFDSGADGLSPVNATASFDNLTVSVPEPTSVAGLVLGAAMLLRRRRA